MFTDEIIRRALQEDLGHGDVTTDLVVPEKLSGLGTIIAKEPMVIAGLGVAGGVFLTVDPAVQLKQTVSDGDPVKPGTTVFTAQGSYRSLLKAERLALNFLQRLCGIATLTRKYVDLVQGSKTKILDTRKTAPLLRHLDKYAVRMGGGTNHRIGLFDGVMVKDNHIAACNGSVSEATKRALKNQKEKEIIVEIAHATQINEAIGAGATWLMLDNMSDDLVALCVKEVAGRAKIEVSGGITLERVSALSKAGVDYISVGALTHSVRAADLSFEITAK